MIQRSDRIPSVPVKLYSAGEATDTTSDEVFGSGKTVFFAVPGAFTPTCHVDHLPGFVANAAKFKAAGVDRIVCASVNDVHVVKAWAAASNAEGIDFIADGNGELARALGLDTDFSAAAMGTRFARSAMIVQDGVVEAVMVETGRGTEATGAQAVLMALETSGSR